MNDYPLNILFIMPIGTATAIGIGAGAAGVINGLVGTAANANLNGKNRRWQEKMSQLAYDRQKELTLLSPSLQKQGLQMAGLSTAAMDGYSGGTASVSSGAPAPNSVPPYVPFDISSAAQIAIADKQANADIALKKSEENLNNKAAGKYDELTDASIAKIKSETNLNDEQIKEVAAHIPVLNNQGDYYNWLASQADIDYQKNAATYQSDIERIKAQNNLSEKQAKAYVKLVDQYASAQLNLIYAQTYNARASGQAQLSQAYTSRLNYQLEASFKDLKDEIMSWDIEKSKKEAYLIKRQGEEYGLNQKAIRDVQDALRRKMNMDTNLAPVNSVSGLVGSVTGLARGLK